MHAPPSASTIVIDSLGVGTLNYTANGANVVTAMDQTGVDTIDTRRSSEIDHLFAAGVATVTMNNGPVTASGDNFDFVLGYGTSDFFGNIEPGTGHDLNADLSGTAAIKIHFSAATNGVAGQLFLYTTGGGFSDNNTNRVGFSGGAGDMIIPYSAFNESINGGVNLHDVDSIMMFFQSQGSFSISQVSAIPEPGVIGFAVIGLFVWRGRRFGRGEQSAYGVQFL